MNSTPGISCQRNVKLNQDWVECIEREFPKKSMEKSILPEHFRYCMGQQSTVVMCPCHWINSTPGISCQINVKLNQELQLGRIHWKRIPEKNIEKSILPEHFRYGMGQQSTVVKCPYNWINSTPGISCQINVELNQELGRMH
jgi:hypothetical protein